MIEERKLIKSSHNKLMNAFYSFIIPVYNSEGTLLELYQQLNNVLAQLMINYEIIFVEDCGSDGSWKILQELAKNDNKVKAIQLYKNSGQAAATLAGFAHAQGDFVITLDDDLQHPPEELPKLINAIADHAEIDVVIGAPKIKEHHGFRNFGSQLVNKLQSWFIKKNSKVRLTSFRIMRRQIAEILLTMKTPFPCIGPMILQVTHRILNIEVMHHSRKQGRSGYTLSSLIRLTLSNVIGYSVKPLHILAIVGAWGIFLSILMATYLLIRYFIIGIGVPGWTTLVLLLITLSSFNFFAFSIIGEYVLRISRSSNNHPLWIARDFIQINNGNTQIPMKSEHCVDTDHVN